jgi:antitoxin (DNA-binding transcriptional repressor) of toxin-antitoxin stability system
MAVTTIRALRNHFPKVKSLVEAEGEVIVTDKGEPKYKLILYSPVRPRKSVPPKDYVTRLSRYQPRPLSRAAAESLNAESRGDR